MDTGEFGRGGIQAYSFRATTSKLVGYQNDFKSEEHRQYFQKHVHRPSVQEGAAGRSVISSGAICWPHDKFLVALRVGRDVF